MRGDVLGASWGLLAMSEPQGMPATHLQPRPREPTRLMKTFFSLFSRFLGVPRLLSPPWRKDRIRVTRCHMCTSGLALIITAVSM